MRESRDNFIPEIMWEWEKRSCDAIRVTIAVSTHTRHGEGNENLLSVRLGVYRGGNKGLYVVARSYFLLLLNSSAWSCMGPA